MDTATIDQLVRANEEIVEEIDTSARKKRCTSAWGRCRPRPGNFWTALQSSDLSPGEIGDAGEGGGERGEDGVIPAAECT